MIALALFAGYHLLSRDEPPPNLDDLAIIYREIPDSQNAYALLTALVESLPSDLLARDDEHADIFNRIVSRELWDADQADQILSGTSTLWPRLQTAVAVPYSQAPRLADTGSDSPTAPLLYQLHRLALLRTRQLAHNGQPEQALNILLALYRMGHHLCDSQDVLVTLLVGMAIQGEALENIRFLVNSHQGHALDIQSILNELEQHRQRPEHWSQAIRQELSLFELNMDSIAASPSHQSFVEQSGWRAWWRHQRLRLLFKPNQTIRLKADYTRRFISLASTDRRSLSASNLDQDFADENNTENRFNPVNLIGRMLLSLSGGRLQFMLDRGFEHQSTLSATQALLAVRAYQHDHDGELPPTLDALVPDYLPAVPLDYYDREPIRYSREFRAIWSLGREGEYNVTSVEQEPGGGELHLRLP
ncbi:MAG: hypothetical protein ABII82_00070 [Verrucomicrobiota bacterium]